MVNEYRRKLLGKREEEGVGGIPESRFGENSKYVTGEMRETLSFQF